MSSTEESVAAPNTSKSLTITVDVGGTMGLDYSGDIKLYEIIGMLAVTMGDLYIKNFVVPYMNQQSVKIVEHLTNKLDEGDGETISKGIQEVQELNDGLKGIMGIIESFKQGQPADST